VAIAAGFALMKPSKFKLKDNKLKIKQIGWRSSSKISLDPELVFDELTKIADKNGGSLFPEAVVAAAKSRRSPLHTVFQWDDDVAANLFRVDQARHLIRSVEVTYVELPEAPVRAFHIQRIEEVDGSERNAYWNTDEILSDPDTRIDLLERAISDLKAVRQRYRVLTELSEVFSEIDKVLLKKDHVNV